MLDVDKCNGRVSEFLQVLKDTPWVKAAWRRIISHSPNFSLFKD